jgi:hypothetical protein
VLCFRENKIIRELSKYSQKSIANIILLA